MKSLEVRACGVSGAQNLGNDGVSLQFCGLENQLARWGALISVFRNASRAIFVTQIVTMMVATRPTLRKVQYCQPCFIASPPAPAETAALAAASNIKKKKPNGATSVSTPR